MLLNTDGKPARRRDSASMIELVNEITLTAEQQQFAEQHDAISAAFCPDTRVVCLYRNQPHTTIRWIVDSYGQLLEMTAFERAA
jgi:hypothetical protein